MQFEDKLRESKLGECTAADTHFQYTTSVLSEVKATVEISYQQRHYSLSAKKEMPEINRKQQCQSNSF